MLIFPVCLFLSYQYPLLEKGTEPWEPELYFFSPFSGVKLSDH